MHQRPWLVQSDKPSYQVLRWIGGGGFGQVYKVQRNNQIVACKQVQVENAEAALDEYDHMRALRGGPHIAALHDGLEWNPSTKTLSFFMDYYKGKDLDRQVQMMRGAAQHFSESQVVEIAYQIASALEFCHEKNILHQDMKPMNILLRESWNPITQRDVPDIFVADFGIASQVQTLGTRITGQRGTPGYEAPEIRGQGYQAAFSPKYDIYAFGCILYRLCTLEEPVVLDDFVADDIGGDYSPELLGLVGTMLSTDRDLRPTAAHVKEQLAVIALHLFTPTGTKEKCDVCQRDFISKNALRKHYKKAGHGRKNANQSQQLPKSALMKQEVLMQNNLPTDTFKQNGFDAQNGPELAIRGAANGTAKYYYDEADLDVFNPAPCAVCNKILRSKRQFFAHLGGAQHYRHAKYVNKRKAEYDPNPAEEKESRFIKWMRKDMQKDDQIIRC